MNWRAAKIDREAGSLKLNWLLLSVWNAADDDDNDCYCCWCWWLLLLLVFCCAEKNERERCARVDRTLFKRKVQHKEIRGSKWLGLDGEECKWKRTWFQDKHWTTMRSDLVAMRSKEKSWKGEEQALAMIMILSSMTDRRMTEEKRKKERNEKKRKEEREKQLVGVRVLYDLHVC